MYLFKNKQQRAQQATNMLLEHVHNTIQYKKKQKNENANA